jgi:Ca2+-binding EF-hand superfamily protein
MQKIGRRYNKDEISGVIKSLDKSGDGKIGFDEFVQ